MLDLFKDYKGRITVNDQTFNNGAEAFKAFKGFEGIVTITLNNMPEPVAPKVSNPIRSIDTTMVYKIKVRQYMTKPATPEFDFHDKWNKGIPMPMRVMVGRKIQETNGMVKMELWGEITEATTTICMKCGRTLTNPVSMYFGIGPECGNHDYTHPFASEEELQEALGKAQEELSEVYWVGWIFKRAIEEEIELGERAIEET